MRCGIIRQIIIAPFHLEIIEHLWNGLVIHVPCGRWNFGVEAVNVNEDAVMAVREWN